jgi:protoporphyrinogen/coproporphyrinogen III oxidase
MRVVVVGGGLTGLAVAWHLRDTCEVVVLEASDRLGGQIRTETLAATHLDVGADAMLARQPEALELVRDLGLADDLVHPRTGSVWLWLDGRLRPLPTGTVMGVPAELGSIARSGVLSPVALARAALEPLLPAVEPGEDVSLGGLVARRYGRAVADRLVEPLLSGVYAGSIDRMSTAATAPPVWAAARRGRMTPALREHRRQASASTEPVFATVRGGLGRVIRALADDLGDRVRTATPVEALEQTPQGWQVRTPGAVLEADHVVVALPAAPAARLLRGAAPEAAEGLRRLDTASVAVVALAYDQAAVADLPEGSGVLVPRVEGRLVKAATWSSRKWPHLADTGRFLLRASIGRVDDRRGLDLDDDELGLRVDDEVRAMTGIRAAAVERKVVRWEDALPQYDVGHLQRVAGIHRAVAAVPGLHVGGAALDGVGLPARVRDARRMAAEVRGADTRADITGR